MQDDERVVDSRLAPGARAARLLPMRRVVPVCIALVALAFLALLLPGSPARSAFLAFLMRRSAPPVESSSPSGTPSPAERPLRIAVGAMISPERTYVAYGQLFTLVAERVGRPAEFVQRRTYREINDLLASGEVDLAWICTGAWRDLKARGAARLLAVPVVGGRATYRAYLLAGPTNGASTLLDLRGRRFAFTDPDSLTGCLVPRRDIASLGHDPRGFFGEEFFTHAHDSSIEAVRRGLADGASVDGLVYDFLAARAPGEVEGVRVLARSPEFPIPPVVVPANLDAALAERLLSAIRSLHRDETGRRLLAEILVDRFDVPDAAAYDAVEGASGP